MSDRGLKSAAGLTLAVVLVLYVLGLILIYRQVAELNREIRVERKVDCLLHRTPHFCFVPAATHGKHV